MKLNEIIVLWLSYMVKSSFNIPLKTSSIEDPSTTLPQIPTTHRNAQLPCISGGFPFSKSDVVDEGFSSSTNTCWQIRCGENGRLIKSATPCEKLDNYEGLATPFSTRKPHKRGCTFNGRRYELGEDIQTLSDWQSDRCYGTRCNKFGEIVAWETFNCYSTPYYSTTTEASTQLSTQEFSSSTESLTSTATPVGCYDNSVMYHPGEEISYKFFSQNQTCCGKYCNFDNKIITWSSASCETHSPVPTTEILTTQVSTIQEEGCFIDGNHYVPNTKIDSGNDGVRWCFGRYCNEQSQIIYWDDFHCNVKASMTPLPTSSDKTMATSTGKTIVTGTDNTASLNSDTTESSTNTIIETNTNNDQSTQLSSRKSFTKDDLEQIDLKVKDKVYSAMSKTTNSKTTKSFLQKLLENFPFFQKS